MISFVYFILQAYAYGSAQLNNNFIELSASPTWLTVSNFQSLPCRCIVRGSSCTPPAGLDSAVLLREELGGDDHALRELTSIRKIQAVESMLFIIWNKRCAAKLVYQSHWLDIYM